MDHMEVERMEVEHMEVVGMSTDCTDNDMAVEVPRSRRCSKGNNARGCGEELTSERRCIGEDSSWGDACDPSDCNRSLKVWKFGDQPVMVEEISDCRGEK
jgi:hypothetical protein